MARNNPFLLPLGIIVITGCPTRLEEHGDKLAIAMSGLERHGAKLGLSIQARNNPLARFYLHELEETTQEIAKHHKLHQGVALEPLLDTIFLPAIAGVGLALPSGEQEGDDATWIRAQAAYEEMINACNACHRASGYPFLVMVPNYTNTHPQDFSPKTSQQE